MTPTKPPRIATWILKHFGCGQDLDVVLGDLAEQYQSNHSAIWYWRQVVQTIPVTLFREVRAHKSMAGRALLTGWALWFFSLLWFFPFVSPWFFQPRMIPKPPHAFIPFESWEFVATGVGAAFSFEDPIGSTASILWMPVGAHMSLKGSPLSDLSGFAFGVVLPLVVAAVCGALVGRFSRRGSRAAVLLFAGSVFLTYVVLFGRFALLIGSGPASALAGPLAAYVTASIAGIVGGGLLSEPAKAS